MLTIYTDIRVTRRNRLHQMYNEQRHLVATSINLDDLLKKAYDMGYLHVAVNDNYWISTVPGVDLNTARSYA